jgi:NAD(P)-dependent dehydrogenase (short-subunit alcohol dehydrogenase family)
MTDTNSKIVLITGANKGLGYETARQLIEHGYTVYIGARDATRGQTAANKLNTNFVQLDVTDDASVKSAIAKINDHEGHLDVLVNNAGISGGIAEVNASLAHEVFETNVVGIIRVTEAALPLLQKSDNPVVVNISSSLGSFWAVTNPERRQFHYPTVIYGSSKAAVSMITVQYAKSYPDIKFNAVEPGFTATDFTNMSSDAQPVEKGGETIVRMATIDKDGPTGTFSEPDGPLQW